MAADVRIILHESRAAAARPQALGGDPSGPLLSRRAIERGDLRELQRVCDAGSDDAGAQLDRLLRGDTPPDP